MKSQSKTTTPTLTIDQTDELVNAASQPADGAIEDCEVTDNVVTYYFESGAVGTVSRINGTVSIDRSAVEDEMKKGHQFEGGMQGGWGVVVN